MSRHGTDKFATATLGALNAELRLQLGSCSGARIDVRGTFVATVVFEATMNGTDWTTVGTSSGGMVSNTSIQNGGTTGAGNFATADLTGFTEFRVRISAYTSGSATVIVALTEESQVDQVGLAGSPQMTLSGAIPAGGNLIGSVFNQDNIFWNESVTAQAISATVTGTSRDTGVAVGSAHRYAAFNAFAFADQAGTMRIELSTDNTTWRRATADQAVAAGGTLYLSVPVTARWHRVVYINGATAQTQFMLNTSYTVA